MEKKLSFGHNYIEIGKLRCSLYHMSHHLKTGKFIKLMDDFFLSDEDVNDYIDRLSMGYIPIPVLAFESVEGNLRIQFTKELYSLMSFFEGKNTWHGVAYKDIGMQATVEDMVFEIHIVKPSAWKLFDKRLYDKH